MKGSCNVPVSMVVSLDGPFLGAWRMKYVGSDGVPSVILPPGYFLVDPHPQLLRYHHLQLPLVIPML